MDGQKAKVALTFALYQGEQLVRRDTIAQDIVKVGKDPRSHLRVDDELASRMHAVIEVAAPTDITLIDLGNEPGTLVNGQRVNKCKIRPGDQIQIGSTLIVLEQAELAGAHPGPTLAAVPGPAPSVPTPLGSAPRGVGAGALPTATPAIPTLPLSSTGHATAGTFASPASAPNPAAPPPPPAPAVAGNPFGGANPFAASNPFGASAAVASNPFAPANPFVAPARDAAPAAMGVGLGIEAPLDGGSAQPGAYTYSMVKSGPDVNPDEVEVAHLAAVEVMVMWETNVLHVSHLTPPRSYYVGEEFQGNGCDYFIPSETLGTTRAPVVVSRGVGAALVMLPRSHGTVDIPGQGKISFADLIASGRAKPSSELSGAHEFELPAGAKARMEFENSALAFQISAVNAGKPVPLGFPLDVLGMLYVMMSIGVHVATLAVFLFFVPSMGADDNEGADRNNDEFRKKVLEATADPEHEEPKPDDTQENQNDKEGGTGTKAKSEEGAMGTPNTKETGHKYGVQGPKDNPDPHLARQAALQEASQYGIIGLISTLAGGDPNAPTAPWGRDDSKGTDDKSAMGNMFGDSIGESNGAGGLGLSGLGEGGGGRGEGIGLGNFGGLGHGAGNGTGDGIGNGRGRGGGGHKVSAPQMREGGTSVNGRLPPEVIQRIVRQHFGQFRLCFEAGLRSNPSLQGRVGVRFAIDRTGAVSFASDGGSDIPDQGVVQCVVSGFRTLSFPAPEGGTVSVSYPIVFSPGD